jgi:hypothetical protein
MYRAEEADDTWAAVELIAQMEKRHQDYFLPALPVGIGAATALISRYQTVITQRFHGIVLAELTQTPYVAIHHHDKLKFSQPNNGKFVSYYNCSKHTLIDNFNQAQCMNYQTHHSIFTDTFKALVNRVTSLL